MEETAAKIQAAAAVTVLCHVHPDADTMGSALALAIALHRAGTPVQVSFPEPHELPRSLELLPRRDLVVPPAALPDAAELLVVVDCSSADRLAGLSGQIAASDTTLVIDHHRTNTFFGDLHYVDADAQSTTVLITRVLDALGVEIDADIATCLYAGLVTDTGGLRWANPESLLLAARLLGTGINGAELLRGLMDTHPFAWLPMLGAVLGRAELEPAAACGLGLVHTVVLHTDVAGVAWEEIESVVDIVRTSAEAEVAVVLKEQGEQRWTVSMRSKGLINVAEVALKLGGGGHAAAAGYSATGTRDDVLAALRSVLG
nr:bifunctional oligoribonuclease/PAP phosphatase NrnA [Tomitella biformata]